MSAFGGDALQRNAMLHKLSFIIIDVQRDMMKRNRERGGVRDREEDIYIYIYIYILYISLYFEMGQVDKLKQMIISLETIQITESRLMDISIMMVLAF